jgi:hypothetical protein
MDEQRSGPMREARRLARRVLVESWYSPVNLMISSRGLVHIARHVLDELHHGSTSVLHASDRLAESVGREGRLPSQD